MRSFGVLCALAAMFGWGFGDFFIQKASRKVGVVTALFVIGAFGGVVLLPFVGAALPELVSDPMRLLILSLAVVAAFFTSLFDFAALKQGKIAIVEPIIALELPITIGLSLILLSETFSVLSGVLMLTAFVGIMLAIREKAVFLKREVLYERGVILAGIGALGMALSNITIGLSSRETSPLITIWYVHTFVALLCLLLMFASGEAKRLPQAWKKHQQLLLTEAVLDTGAWLAYAYAAVALPISVATTISQSYTVVAVALGVWLNKERVRGHQRLGIFMAIVSVLLLAYLYHS